MYKLPCYNLVVGDQYNLVIQLLVIRLQLHVRHIYWDKKVAIASSSGSRIVKCMGKKGAGRNSRNGGNSGCRKLTC